MSSTNPSATKYIYKIAPSAPKPSTSCVSRSDDAHILPPSALDTSSGFIHMSTAVQVPGTLKHFFHTEPASRSTVYLLRFGPEVEPLERKGVVRWESPDAKIGGPRHGEGMFPHLYFDGEEGENGERRLWLRVSEIESIVEVVSEVGADDWEDGLRAVKDWLL